MATNNRPKVEIGLNESVELKLLKDKPYEGSNSYGTFWLYSVEHQAQEKAFFATSEIHKQILEAGLRTGDAFSIKKVAVQNGKKVIAKVEFEVLTKHTPPAKVDGNGQDSEDGFRLIMEKCLREAVAVTSAVNTVPWQNEDIRSIALTMFIQRSRNH
jgi:hypothetical protein